MELDEAIRKRRMCRSFLDRPVGAATVDRLLDAGRRAPSAGHTQGWAFVVLEGREQTDAFWEHASESAWRADPNWPGLLQAPVVIVPLCSAEAYLERYREADKVGAGRDRPQGWPVPYWLVDASFAVMLMLLEATQEGLGALFFALHGDADALLRRLGVPPGWQPLGAIALGWPAGDDRPSPSAARGRNPLGEVAHRGGW